jgi:hypothetical protein
VVADGWVGSLVPEVGDVGMPVAVPVGSMEAEPGTLVVPVGALLPIGTSVVDEPMSLGNKGAFDVSSLPSSPHAVKGASNTSDRKNRSVRRASASLGLCSGRVSLCMAMDGASQRARSVQQWAAPVKPVSSMSSGVPPIIQKPSTGKHE